MDSALEKANECLAERVSVPGAPLWHMGKVALFGTQQSFELLQNSIDYLTCKAKAGLPFSGLEKEFLKEVFEGLWYGGRYKGFHEAASLASHYVNGRGRRLRISNEVYRASEIVKDAMSAMRHWAEELTDQQISTARLSSQDQSFRVSSHARQLHSSKRHLNTQGYLLSNGALLAEQNNARLKNADHRFYLQLSVVQQGEGFNGTWRVESLYDFEPFAKGYVTHIPLGTGFILKLPDGLSQHLTKIGVAVAFTYEAVWEERWKRGE